MKFKITITKEVIDKSLMCGVDNPDISTNCGFAIAYSELVPVSVGIEDIYFWSKDGNDMLRHMNNERIKCDTTEAQCVFISIFDSMTYNPKQRYTLVGQTFDVEIPDEVIEYWYGDASQAAQKIIDNPIMQVA